MLRINRDLLSQLQTTPNQASIVAALNLAVQLELSTIPPYLTALFSVQSGSNRAAAALVQSVVTEEMLHMTLAANTLIAIGANPDIVTLANELQYPGALPGKVDNNLQVSLAALSKEQVYKVFMAIEKPDTSDILPGESAPNPDPHVPGEFASIGEFYQAIMAAIAAVQASGVNLFASPRTAQQVDISKWFPPVKSAPAQGYVVDQNSANAALQTIINQGEGVDASGDAWLPTDCDGSYAHYFKFGEIYYGATLVRDAAAPSGWSYSGAPVSLDSSTIYNFAPNAALSDYAEGSGARVFGENFYNTYQMLLGSLNSVFNGAPDQLNAAMGLMYQLKLIAAQVAQYPAGGSAGVAAAPPFMLTHA
ncbi:ferritin-like protein [Massilia sp. W12]|uniref:ferritin-like domain-containing protein n=1 Tax=Massilia sp. W12 TaxID=3126507 RepID=UPI0030D5C0ED